MLEGVIVLGVSTNRRQSSPDKVQRCEDEYHELFRCEVVDYDWLTAQTHNGTSGRVLAQQCGACMLLRFTTKQLRYRELWSGWEAAKLVKVWFCCGNLYVFLCVETNV